MPSGMLMMFDVFDSTKLQVTTCYKFIGLLSYKLNTTTLMIENIITHKIYCILFM